MNRSLALALVFVVAGLTLACDQSSNSGGRCRGGESIACTCDDGRSGTGTCGLDSCDCPPAFALRAEPGSLAFGEVARGNSRDAVLLVHNPAPREVRLKAVGFVEDAGAYRLPDQLPEVIPAGGSVPVTVRFEPRHVGSAVARLRIEADDGDVAPVEVIAHGFSPGPLLSCLPSRVGFGQVWFGASATLTVMCTNVGVAGSEDEARLVFIGLDAEGEGFRAAWRETPPVAGIPVGASVGIEVTFEPPAEGVFAGLLRVTGEEMAMELPLSGSSSVVPSCDLEILPQGLEDTGVPGTGRTRDIALRNLHPDAPCTVSGIRLCEGTDPAYSIPDMPQEPLVLPGGGELRIPLHFAPQEGSCGGQPTDGCVEFDLEPSPSGHRMVPLSCWIVPPEVLVAPVELDFSAIGIGCGSRLREGQVIVFGSRPVTLESVVVGPETSAEFSIAAAPPAGTVIGPGLSVVITVSYQPVDAGEDLGEVLVRLREVAEPFRLLVRGSGVDLPLRVEHYEQNSVPKLDVLVVIDNGTSMAEESPWIRQELANLPFAALFSGADAQFAVTTTGLVPGGPGCSGGVDGGEDGRLFPVDGSRPRILDGNTPDRDAAWDANLAVGACHSEPPQGLEAALRALTPPLSASADDPRHPEAADGNLGFLRPDAMLHVLVISDRADVSPGTDDAYYQAFVALKDGDSSRFGFHAVTGDPGEGCGGNGRSAEAGDRLISMVVRTYTGRWGSICDSTLDGLFGWRPVGRRRCFYLQTEPEDLDGDGRIVPADGELRVWVDGVSVPDVADGEPIWQYRPYEVAVCFAPEHVPASGSMIEVEYPVVCLSR